MEKFKTFFYFAIIAVLAMIVFIAGAISAASGPVFNLIIGILAMLEAVTGLVLALRELRKRSQEKTQA